MFRSAREKTEKRWQTRASFSTSRVHHRWPVAGPVLHACLDCSRHTVVSPSSAAHLSPDLMSCQAQRHTTIVRWRVGASVILVVLACRVAVSIVVVCGTPTHSDASRARMSAHCIDAESVLSGPHSWDFTLLSPPTSSVPAQAARS